MRSRWKGPASDSPRQTLSFPSQRYQRDPQGFVIAPSGEQFGVVEHKIGNVIGPLLGSVHSFSGGSAVGGWSPNNDPSSTLDGGRSIDPNTLVEPAGPDSNEDDEITETNGLGGPKVTRPIPNPAQDDGRQLYIECCVIRRGEQNPMMLPLQLLVFCMPQSVSSVAAYLSRSGVTLEHPVSYHPEMHLGCLYDNPHSSQPREAMENIRQRLLGTSIYPQSHHQPNRMTTQACDHHQQVATIFKSLASGVDLDETEPGEMIITPLYPHQKQALSFMLDRETLKLIPEDHKSARSPIEKKALEKEDEENLVTLWKKTRDSYGRHVGWMNVVTGIQQIGRQTPTQCRGAILADDMGLGKTISIISLIVTTLEAALEYAKSPILPSSSTTTTTTTIDLPLVKDSSSTSSSKALDPPPPPISPAHPTLQGSSTRSGSSPFEAFQDDHHSTGSRMRSKKEGTLATKKRLAVQDRLQLIKVKSRATLIICPLSTVQNWESQIEEHVRCKPIEGDGSSSPTPKSSSSLSVCVYHGNSRTSDPHALADHDVVITTYSLLGYEFSRQNRTIKELTENGHESSDGVEELDAQGHPIPSDSRLESKSNLGKKSLAKARAHPKRKRRGDGLPSPLQAIQWFRVVLDEAHMIKEHTTTQSKAACDLLAERRICLTGTPLQNSLNDLFSLVCFLRLEPFTDRALWTTHIGTPARLGEPLGVSRLQLIMRHIALRRTKQTSDKHGKPILTLPPKKDDIVYLELNPAEKEVYSMYHQRSRKTFMTLNKEDTIMKNYCSILQELLRLRQICTHVGLIPDVEAQAGRELDLARRIEREGFSRSRAIELLILMRDTGATQCSECGAEAISASTSDSLEEVEELKESAPSKRGRKKSIQPKKKLVGLTNKDDPEPRETLAMSVITKCQHLFCSGCYRDRLLISSKQGSSQEGSLDCSVCGQPLVVGSDLIEISSIELQESIRLEELQTDRSDGKRSTVDSSSKGSKRTNPRKTKPARLKDPEPSSPVITREDLNSEIDRKPLVESVPVVDKSSFDLKPGLSSQHGTKITQLILDLLPFSRANPASINYSPQDRMFNEDYDPNDPDADFKPTKGAVVKSVVFSQWTKLLDKIAIALDEFKIEYRKLDGTMNRIERNRSMDALKMDPKCEVLLVSLRAGGVGLNLTCAQRVYLMEPFWNPAVESQAVDRVHRLGQTKPVRMIRYIISGSVEQNMLEIQKRKTELANMSLGQTLSKAELAKRRVEDLHILFKENINSNESS